MSNNRIRDLLNEIRWRDKFDFENVEVWFVHRGFPDDTKIIYGKDISSIGISFLETTSGMIPFHRIFKIIYNGETIFKR